MVNLFPILSIVKLSIFEWQFPWKLNPHFFLPWSTCSPTTILASPCCQATCSSTRKISTVLHTSLEYWQMKQKCTVHRVMLFMVLLINKLCLLWILQETIIIVTLKLINPNQCWSKWTNEKCLLLFMEVPDWQFQWTRIRSRNFAMSSS